MQMAPREGQKVPLMTRLHELPKLAADRREHYLFERLNRIHELELTRRRLAALAAAKPARPEPK